MLQHASTVWPVAARWHRSLCAQAASSILLSSSTSHDSAAGVRHVPVLVDADSSSHRLGPLADAAHLASPHDPSPAGQMDAASALAAMSGAAGPPPVLVAGPVHPRSASAAPAAHPGEPARRSDAMSGLLRAAAAGAADAELDELSDDAPPVVSVKQQDGDSAAFGGLHTPHSERGPSGAVEPGELRVPNFGDLDELRAFVGIAA